MFEMKKKLRWSALKSGLLISLALLVLFIVVLYAGSLRRIFTPTVELRARFQDVRGLRKGAQVWLFGTQVGSVEQIRLDSGLIVMFAIEKKAESFLRSDAEAEVRTMGLLGEVYLELTPGSPGAPPLQTSEILKGTSPVGYTQVVDKSGKAIEKITELIGKIEILIGKIAEGHGTLSKLIQDPSLFDRTLAVVSSLEKVTKDLEAGQGSLGKLLVDPSLYDNLNKSAQNLDAILSSINRGQGVAGALVRDEQMVGDLKEALMGIGRLIEQMKSLLKDVEDHPNKYFKFSLF